jgi:hypothetical protein
MGWEVGAFHGEVELLVGSLVEIMSGFDLW